MSALGELRTSTPRRKNAYPKRNSFTACFSFSTDGNSNRFSYRGIAFFRCG
jgi:hypothetical protein